MAEPVEALPELGVHDLVGDEPRAVDPQGLPRPQPARGSDQQCRRRPVRMLPQTHRQLHAR